MAINALNESMTFPFDVSGAAADRLRLTVKAKLKEFSQIYTDDVLSEYVVVLVGHGKQQAQATVDLEAFLGENTESFVAWLWDHLTVNKQLYLTDLTSVETVKSVAGGEEQSSVKPRVELELTSQLVGLEVTTKKGSRSAIIHSEEVTSSEVPSKIASSQPKRNFKHLTSSSKEDTFDLVQDRHRPREVQHVHDQVREQKRHRSPEPWSQRVRARSDEKEQRKKGPTSLHVRASRRLLESAIREAVAPVANHPRKTKSKRLRSIASDKTDHSASMVEPIWPQYASRSRATVFKQGGIVSPAMIVALKAAAAAAEDVNSYNKKNQARILSNVWGRLGTKSSEHPPVQEEVAEVTEELEDSEEIKQAQPVEETSEVEEGLVSDESYDSLINSRHEWPFEEALVLDDIGPSDDETMLFDEVESAPSGASHEENDAFDRHISSNMARDGYDDGPGFPNRASQGYSETLTEAPADATQRHNFENNIAEETRKRVPEEATILQYRYAPNLEQAELDSQQKVPSSSGRFNNSHKTVFLSSLKNTNNQMGSTYPNAQTDIDVQKDRLLRADDNESSEMDVSEMRKRMRQVELEMTKLRARQAEVTKEVQKVTAAPASGVKSSSVKPSEDDVDTRSVFVANVHFATTKEAISLHFANCGDIVRVTMLTDGATGIPKGSAYVEFSSKDGVEKALNLNESNLLSRPLKVVRKEAAFAENSPVIRPGLSHPLRLTVRPVVRGTFLRRPPVLMRASRMLRPFPGAQRLQWTRETSYLVPPHGLPTGSFMPSVNGYRPTGGPIRHKRSFSYVRGTSGTPCEASINVQEQKVG
ncbi:hypothetical protein O6H91_07G134400 [Diphasiastrum complanatum]|uniref:Uncharacterized protein n=1 Tax=Diphasiastrum complanatum TaxID=34168 RepID=A0ACC2DAA6_DIPCM|nr:hypothetical protein O6H91_07G134400 [Diphasiastrum complanatum]